MNLFSYQRNPKRSRFSLPNDIWKWELKPQGFSILAYICYLHIHCKKDVLPSGDEIAFQLHMRKDMAAEWMDELKRRGLLDQHIVPVFKNTSKNFFSLPNELFFLNIGHGAITVYAYLLYCEDRRTHQCHPSLSHHLHCSTPDRVHCDEAHHKVGGQAVHYHREYLLH